MTGRKVWAADEVLSAADLNEYLGDQVITIFSSATARDSAMLTPIEGQTVYLQDSNVYQSWNGSAWVSLGNAVGTVPNATYALTAGTATNASKVSNQTVFIQSSTPTATATNDLWFW